MQAKNVGLMKARLAGGGAGPHVTVTCGRLGRLLTRSSQRISPIVLATLTVNKKLWPNPQLELLDVVLRPVCKQQLLLT